MRSKANIYLYLVILAMMSFGVIFALLSMEELEAKLLPVMFGGIVGLLTVAGLLARFLAGVSSRKRWKKKRSKARLLRSHWCVP